MLITLSLYKKLIKPPVFQSSAWQCSESPGTTPSAKPVKRGPGEARGEAAEQQPRGRPGDSLAWSRCGNFLGTTDLAFASQLTSSERYFTLKAFSWFFEMGLVTWKLVLKIQKYIGSSTLEIFELLKQVGPPDTQILTPKWAVQTPT